MIPIRRWFQGEFLPCPTEEKERVRVRGRPSRGWKRPMKYLLLVLILFPLGVFPDCLWAQLDLQYQTRGDQIRGDRWKEGVRPKPVSGYDIELISVLTDYQEPITEGRFPKKVKLRFYLDKEQPVYVTVRELDYRTYYWLNNVELKTPWAVGFHNEFVWPATPVLKELQPPLQLYELGALVRLGTETTSSIERVAPAVLYHANSPKQIEGYVFTLKTGEDSRLEARMVEKATGKEVDNKKFRRLPAGRPFTFHWMAKEAPAGAYQLDITGFSLSTSQRISQEIHFYHQPFLTP